MKLLTSCVILTILSLILTSCSPSMKINSINKETTVDNTGMEQTETKNIKGGFAFNYNLENYFTTEQSHYIGEQEEYKANIEVINYFGIRAKFRIFIFIDSKLTNIVVNNKNQSFIDIDLNDSEGLKTSFEVPYLSEGKHELIALLVLNPDKGLEKPEYVDFSHFAKKYSVIVGNKKNIKNESRRIQ